MTDLTELQVLRTAESLLTDAYLLALSTNNEGDWAYAKELRAKCDTMRVKLGMPRLDSPSAS
jgi:hypothetical protein